MTSRLIGIALVNLFIFVVGFKLRYDNLVCESYTPSVVVEACFLKSVNRSYGYGTVRFKTCQISYSDIWANIYMVQRANGWKPWLYNYTINFCEFIKRRNNPLVKFVYGLVEDNTNFARKCGKIENTTLYIENVSYPRVEQLAQYLPMPSGKYGLITNWQNKGAHFKINAYFTIEE